MKDNYLWCDVDFIPILKSPVKAGITSLSYERVEPEDGSNTETTLIDFATADGMNIRIKLEDFGTPYKDEYPSGAAMAGEMSIIVNGFEEVDRILAGRIEIDTIKALALEAGEQISVGNLERLRKMEERARSGEPEVCVEYEEYDGEDGDTLYVTMLGASMNMNEWIESERPKETVR